MSALCAAVLVKRGITDPGEVERFLHPELDHLHSPSLLPDYEPAIKAILNAKERNEKIFVHGDYDVDGITSAALFGRFLKRIGCDVHVHVPHRMKEGYGIHAEAVKDAAARGTKLFLTCDCGVSAHDQVTAAKEHGMTVVVTDHHEVGDVLPDAQAVINPHRKDSKYPFSNLSGVGVAFKLCSGITEELGHKKEQFYRAFLDLTALGTVADVMPLVDENRVIVRHGLPLISQTNKEGLKALLQLSMADRQQDLRAWHIGFRLGPRLNAAGRIQDAALSLSLLLESDPAAALSIAQQLDEINTKRRAEQQRICQEAIEYVTESGLAENPVIVVSSDGWHPGIIGLVAGRLVEQFRRPTFVVSADKITGIGKGSARTISGFHLADALKEHSDLLIGGGGHAMAAGFSLHLDKLEQFSKQLTSYAAKLLTEEHFQLEYMVDAEVSVEEANEQAVSELQLLEPHGEANREPMFLARGVSFSIIKPTSNPEHCSVTLRSPQGSQVQAIGFGLGQRLAEVSANAIGDVLFCPTIDVFNGRSLLKWHIKDFVIR